MASSLYRRLTGKARSLGGYSQLWLAPDHLLLLRSTGFRQQYWRFALADIQAVIVTQLPSRMPLQVVFVALVIGWELLFMVVASTFAKGFFIVTGGIGLAFVIADIARGPRCRCFLHTAVSREPLTPVRRVSTARRVLAQLQPAVEAVQGSIALEQIQQIEDQSSSRAAGVGPDQPPEIVNQPGYLPETLFGLFLVNAALILASVQFHNAQVMGLLPTSLFAELLLVIVALVRRGSRDFRRYVYVLMVITLLGIGWDLYLFAWNFARWVVDVAEAGQHGRAAPLPTTPGAAFDKLHGTIAAGWRIAASLLGFAAAYWERRSHKPPAV
jgi:hypothetical protein